MRKIFEQVDVKQELPPQTDDYFIITYAGSGSWYEDEVGELTGKEIHGMAIIGHIKTWFKPLDYESISIL
jgi:hypothetical protein